MPEPTQLTIDGRAEPLRRSCEDCGREIVGTVFATIGGGEDADARCADCDRAAAQRIFARYPLFTAPQTMRGQLAMPTDRDEDPAFSAWDCPECGHHNEPMTTLCHVCGWDSSAPSEHSEDQSAD